MFEIGRRIQNGSECCMLYSQLVEGKTLSPKSGRMSEKDNICARPINVSEYNNSGTSSNQ